MMKVYFVQHGIALSKDHNEKRPLSEAGENEVRTVAQHLKTHEVAISKICHSGKLRARQTAELFAEILNVGVVSEISGLKPNDAPEMLIQQINDDGVMYIGHLPNLQHVVAKIAGSNGNSPVIKFQNAGVVCIDIEEGEGRIEWFITPAMC